MENTTMFRCSTFYEMGMECDTDEERLALWQAIMEYGLFGKEPPREFKRDFVNIRFILGRSKEISEERSKAGRQGGAPKGNKNAVKNKGKQAKQAKQAKTTKTSESDSNSHSNSSNDKCMYLEYVYLSNEEYNKLVEGYGESAVKNKIEDLNNYIGQQGKDKYKSHYHTLSNWLKKDGAKKITASNTTRREDGIYDLDDF